MEIITQKEILVGQVIWSTLNYGDILNISEGHRAYRAILSFHLGEVGLYLVWCHLSPAPAEPIPLLETTSPKTPILKMEEHWNFLAVTAIDTEISSWQFSDNHMRVKGRHLTDFVDGWPALVRVQWVDKPGGKWPYPFDEEISWPWALALLRQEQHRQLRG